MDKATSLSIHVIAFAAFSIACYFGATVMITIVLAILTAYLLDPLVHLFRRIRFPRSISIGISMLVAGILVAIVLSLLLARAQQFADNLPRYQRKIQRVSNDITARIRKIQKRSEDISKSILPAEPRSGARTVRVEQPSQLRDFITGQMGHYLVQISFFPFLVYFLLAEKERIGLFITNLVRSGRTITGNKADERADKLVTDLNARIKGFVVGYLWSTIILFVVSWVVFMAFGVAEAVVWALIFSLLNILPFVGAILAALPPLVIAILQFTSIQKTLAFILLCIGLHLIYANWLIPRTTGPRTQLSPLAVLLAMMYWGFLWGPIGIFLAIPLTASLRTIWTEYGKLSSPQDEDPEKHRRSFIP